MWIFRWMEHRTVSAHDLVGEAITFAYDSAVGSDRPALLGHLIAAAMYLRVLLFALRPELDEMDVDSCVAVMTELGARHRPAVDWHPDRTLYLRTLLSLATRDAHKVRRLVFRIRGRRVTPIVEGLDVAMEHLARAARLCRPPGRDELTAV